MTALTEVKVLVMRTDDFVSFISAHPRVLEFVESQIYQRLAEDSDGYAMDGLAGGGLALRPGGQLLGVRRPVRSLTGENCTVLLTDVVEFGTPDRSDEDRKIVRLQA